MTDYIVKRSSNGSGYVVREESDRPNGYQPLMEWCFTLGGAKRKANKLKRLSLDKDKILYKT